jgi:hypothetical protein
MKMTGKLFVQITFAAAAVAAALSLGSCSKKSLVDVKPVRKGEVGEEYVVQASDRREPRWLKDSRFEVEKEKGARVIYVWAEIYGPKDKRAAERMAESELRRNIAEGIETLVQSQYREALEGVNEAYTERFDSFLVTVAENVNVVGLVVTETYWERIQRIASESEVEYIFRVYKRGKMPYDNYTRARDKAWRDVLAGRTSEDEKEQLRMLVAEMREMDEL